MCPSGRRRLRVLLIEAQSPALDARDRTEHQAADNETDSHHVERVVVAAGDVIQPACVTRHQQSTTTSSLKAGRANKIVHSVAHHRCSENWKETQFGHTYEQWLNILCQWEESRFHRFPSMGFRWNTVVINSNSFLWPVHSVQETSPNFPDIRGGLTKQQIRLTSLSRKQPITIDYWVTWHL